MKYSFIAKLISWIFPTRKDRQQFRKLCDNIDVNSRIKSIKKNYKPVLKRIVNKKDTPLKVLFLVNELSKWKCQTVYDLMEKSSDFEPVIALNIADIQVKLPLEEKIKILNTNKKFFEEKDMKVVVAYDTKKDKALELKTYSPDIVFYQQPYNIMKKQTPLEVSKYALICYVPYYVHNYGDWEFDCNKELHRATFRFYTLNQELAETFSNYADEHAGEFIGAGHPILDNFYLNKDYKAEKNYVIYAPHWSIKHPLAIHDENFSTFDKNGKEILEYAKQHPEINWAFKPHPTLRQTLITTGIMTKEEVDNYYKEWENLGEACYTSDYIKLFLESKALITDCGSFLTEYFCTGKPVIHLISDDCFIAPKLISKKTFRTFYQVHSLDEMYKTFDNILINNKDDKKDERISLLKETGLSDTFAAQNILDDLRKNLIPEIK